MTRVHVVGSRRLILNTKHKMDFFMLDLVHETIKNRFEFWSVQILSRSNNPSEVWAWACYIFRFPPICPQWHGTGCWHSYTCTYTILPWCCTSPYWTLWSHLQKGCFRVGTIYVTDFDIREAVYRNVIISDGLPPSQLVPWSYFLRLTGGNVINFRSTKLIVGWVSSNFFGYFQINR